MLRAGVPGVIEASAPVRICDLGGWTDTWFAGGGQVCNIAVSPRVEVRVEAREVAADVHGGAVETPLLAAAAAEIGVPEGLEVTITTRAGVPPGSSTGTSAAITVAVLAALDALTPGRLSADDLARRAHAVEVERLGLQSGVQDQLAAAHGGICFITIDEYPRASVEQVAVPAPVWRELERRLLLVYLGRPHVSSEVHDIVIADLERAGSAATLEPLRDAAGRGRAALVAGDLEEFGRAMVANTVAQQSLHPALVSEQAAAQITVASARRAAGWKVNGAGGDGGSLTFLSGRGDTDRAALLEALVAADPQVVPIPIRLEREGVRVSAHR